MLKFRIPCLCFVRRCAQGMAVWGGPNFTRINRFGHQNVRLIDFSPNEKYILSYTSHEPATARDSFHVLINVWDVRSGKQLRKFEGPVDEYAVGSSAGPNGALKWPVFKWAGGRDDLFFARLGRGKISIYECPSMTMLGKESLKLDGVQVRARRGGGGREAWSGRGPHEHNGLEVWKGSGVLRM